MTEFKPDTYWVKDNNMAEIMPKIGQAIRASVAIGIHVEVNIKEAKTPKTRQQEKYAHACIGEIAKFVGENPEHLKIRIKDKLGLIEEVYSQGRTITTVRTTASLTRDEYGKFIDAIQQTANYLNVILPQPKDMGFYW